MGAGDVKLTAAIGTVVGPYPAFITGISILTGNGWDEDTNLKGPAASGEASQLPSSLKL
jgi:hypothetical protein